MSVQIEIALTALCRDLCILLCKVEVPSNAKPTKPEIIVLKIPLLLFHPLGNLGNIKSTSFFNK